VLEALLYVTDSGTDTIVERTTYEPLDSVTVGVDPFAMVVGPSGLRAYVTISGSDTVSVIDTLTRTVATTIGVGDRPADVAIRPNTFQIYGANQGGDSVINRITDTVTATVTGLSAPVMFFAVLQEGRWPPGPA
jgi:YVTN family beta-propeller protein